MVIRTLSSTGNFLSHYLAFPALSLVVSGLVMLNRGPFVVTGEDGRGGAKIATLMTGRINPPGLPQQPAKPESHNTFFLRLL